MATYYRVSSIGDALPETWGYCDAYDLARDGIELGRGAQVFSDLNNIILTIYGIDVDGTYDEAHGYDRVLLIEADATVDGGPWSAVAPEDVTALRSISIADVKRIAEASMGDEGYDEDEIEEWADDHAFDLDEVLLDALREASTEAAIVWVDTLGADYARGLLA
jgi:hypothetical protein